MDDPEEIVFPTPKPQPPSFPSRVRCDNCGLIFDGMEVDQTPWGLYLCLDCHRILADNENIC